MVLNTQNSVVLDIHQNHIVSVFAKQYDNNTRFLDIQIIDNNEFVNLTGTTLFFKAKTSRDRNILEDITSSLISENKIRLGLTEDILFDPGKTKAEIQIIDTDTKQVLSTMPFYIYVTQSVYQDDELVSSREYGVLLDIIDKAEETTELIEAQLERAEQLNIILTDLKTEIEELEENVSDAEDTRVSNENVRIENENTRISNEDARISAENVRASNENVRIEKENTRIEAENLRVSNESQRQTNESTRQANEATRISNENTRKANENVRKSNENIRNTNENTRKTNEENRVNAEIDRETDCAEAVANAQTATAEVLEVKDEAEAAKDAANEASVIANEAAQRANDNIDYILSVLQDATAVQSYQLGVPTQGIIIGVATLDTNGLVPENQLPGFVDDVVEGTANNVQTLPNGSTTAESFTLTGESTPCTPEAGKIYLDTSSGVQYRWSGSLFVSTGSPIVLGETSSTAFPGNRGKAIEDAMVYMTEQDVQDIINGDYEMSMTLP